jgi:hypothetical protein
LLHLLSISQKKETPIMCDYSLHGLKNRLAKEGETLIVHRFLTGSKGLTAPEYLKPTPPAKGLWAKMKRMFDYEPPVCAVCIPDGARLILDGISKRLQEAYQLSVTETVTFRQLSAKAATYRDAVEFANGSKVRLQELDEGLRLGVLTLSSAPEDVREETLVRTY